MVVHVLWMSLCILLALLFVIGAIVLNVKEISETRTSPRHARNGTQESK
jgi:hypothetical protein